MKNRTFKSPATFTKFPRAPTDEVVHSVTQHVGGLSGTVEAEVLSHGLLLLGRLAHLLRSTDGHVDERTFAETTGKTLLCYNRNKIMAFA